MKEYISTHIQALLPGAKHASDRKTVRDRFEQEGIGFLDALERLGSHLQVSLDKQRWIPVHGFARKGTSVLPRFLGSEFAKIFNDKGELLRADNEEVKHAVDAVRLILQVCFFAKKFGSKPTEEMKAQQYTTFLKTQADLKERLETGFYNPIIEELSIGIGHAPLVRSIMAELWDVGEIGDGAYGPGSNLLNIEAQTLSERTPDPYTFSQDSRSFTELAGLVTKYHQPRNHLDLGPLQLNIFDESFRWSHLSDREPVDTRWGLKAQDLDVFIRHNRPRCVQNYCKLQAVAKNRKKARLIGKMHPDHVYLQLALEKSFKRRISKNTFWSKAIPLTDQRIPSEKAIWASLSGVWATLDMSAASDWVSKWLVENFTPPEIWAILKDTRAEYAEISGVMHEVYSYGQMGDGTTFVILSSIIASIVLATLELCGADCSNPYDPPLIVYGDDIQIPTRYADAVVFYLERYGLKVNRDKSFFSPGGCFRESCDGWGAFGYPVKPVWLKCEPAPNDPESIESVLSSARLLDERGFTNVADMLYERVETALGYRLPYVRSDSPYIGRFYRRGSHHDAFNASLKKKPVRRLAQHRFHTSSVGSLRYSLRNVADADDFYRNKSRMIRSLRGYKLVKVKSEPISRPVNKPQQLSIPYPKVTLFKWGMSLETFARVE